MALRELGVYPERLIGASCREVVEQILSLHPEIIKVSFSKFLYVPQIIGREKGDVLLWIDKKAISHGALDKEISGLERGWDLGIRSQVVLENGCYAHVPMMDFCLSKSSESVTLIKKRMREITGEGEGFILESGTSYHYYGLSLRTEESWREFMAKCLLTGVFRGKGQPFLQVADQRYIGHSLLGGGCVLRITVNAERKFMPVVVATL